MPVFRTWQKAVLLGVLEHMKISALGMPEPGAAWRPKAAQSEPDHWSVNWRGKGEVVRFLTF